MFSFLLVKYIGVDILVYTVTFLQNAKLSKSVDNNVYGF